MSLLVGVLLGFAGGLVTAVLAPKVWAKLFGRATDVLK